MENNLTPAKCSCSKSVRVYRDRTYESDGKTSHVCDPEYVTDYWFVTNQGGQRIAVAHGETNEQARGDALKSKTVREWSKRQGGFSLRRMRSKDYAAYLEEELRV